LTLYFLESSALAKLFVQELGSERLIALVEPLENAQKLISALAPVEVRSAIRRRMRAGDLSRANAEEALSLLSVESAVMVEQPVNALVIEAARQMTDRHALRSLDAIQLAVVSGVTDVVFVALDRALLSAAESEGFPIWDPAAG
jgi:predicted nucleic acid-binding protein